MPVCTVRPRQDTSRGIPTLTETNVSPTPGLLTRLAFKVLTRRAGPASGPGNVLRAERTDQASTEHKVAAALLHATPHTRLRQDSERLARRRWAVDRVRTATASRTVAKQDR